MTKQGFVRPPRTAPRVSAVVLGVLVALFVTFGPLLGNGLPRQQVCIAGGGCEVILDWGGFVPDGVLLMAGAITGLVVAVLSLALAVLGRRASHDARATGSASGSRRRRR